MSGILARADAAAAEADALDADAAEADDADAAAAAAELLDAAPARLFAHCLLKQI